MKHTAEHMTRHQQSTTLVKKIRDDVPHSTTTRKQNMIHTQTKDNKHNITIKHTSMSTWLLMICFTAPLCPPALALFMGAMPVAGQYCDMGEEMVCEEKKRSRGARRQAIAIQYANIASVVLPQHQQRTQHQHQQQIKV
jgi:hypothetical protein